MGYAWNGVCHQDAAAALSAFSKDVPSASASGINAFTVNPSISGGGLISWSISNLPLSGTTATERTGTTQLQPCTEGIDQWPIQSIVLPAVLFLAAFLGFSTGYRP